MPGRPLTVRRPGFAYPADLPLAWNPPAPELSCVANSISLLMPYVEPYLVRTIRSTLPELDEPLRSQAADFVLQEAQHHGEHRRFNDLLAVQCLRVRRVEGWMRRTYEWLGRTRSRRFAVAYAASSETIAFGIARWVDRHVHVLFDQADPAAASLFLWHLAEEVEHKSTAYEVFEATDGSRWRYAGAALASVALLMLFSFASTVVMLAAVRRLWSPVAWLRLVRWSVSLAFTMLPLLVVSALPGHAPSSLVDPPYLTQWLRGLDAA